MQYCDKNNTCYYQDNNVLPGTTIHYTKHISIQSNIRTHVYVEYTITTKNTHSTLSFYCVNSDMGFHYRTALQRI